VPCLLDQSRGGFMRHLLCSMDTATLMDMATHTKSTKVQVTSISETLVGTLNGRIGIGGNVPSPSGSAGLLVRAKPLLCFSFAAHSVSACRLA